MAKKFNSIWPPPVYVGVFADGTTCRMSFATQAGKPLDYARGRRLVTGVIGRERARAMTPAHPDYFASNEYRKLLRHYAQRLIDDVAGKRCLEWGAERREWFNDGALRREPGDKRYHRGRYVYYRSARIVIRSLPLFRTFLPPVAPATDIVDGWVEKGDETFPDPHFAPESTGEVVQLRPKRRVLSDLDKALALLAKLSEQDRATLRERMAA